MTVGCLMHTMHVQARTRQRDFREIDAQLIVDLGTEVRTGVFMLTDSEADVLIAELSMLADPQDRTRYGMSAGEPERRIDGLRDAIVMVEGRTVITAFHKTAPYLRTDPRRDPHCRHRRQRREAEQRRRVFGHIVPL